MNRLRFLLAAAITAVPLGQTPRVADTVLTNGMVLTVDARDSVAQAVAIAGGKIIAVGTNREIQALVGPNTTTIDLHGRTVTPGLIDTHCHFQESIDQLDFGDPSIKNMADVIAKIRQWIVDNKVQPGEWVRGRGWDEGKLAERRYILASDIDKAAPNNPVWLTHTTGHYGVGNSLALKLANVTKDTKDPAAGTIDRDKDGNPTGVMKEAATGLVTRAITSSGPRTSSTRDDVLRIIAGFNREGMTAVKDLNINQGRWDLYKQLLDEGKLTVRMFALWAGGRTVASVQQAIARMSSLPHPPQSLGEGRLFSGGVKLYIDGSGGARTAWMYDDWNKDFTGTDTGNVGYPTTDPEIYRQQVRLLTDAGISIGTHAIGDRGIDWVVDSYAEALKANPKKGLRHSIIHSNTPTDHAIETMAMLQKTYDAGYPEAQAPFMWWIGDTYAGNLGPERSKRLLPFRTFVDKGIIWGGGSDYNVTPYAARIGLWATVARETLNATYGRMPFGTAQSVDIHVALKSYTIWAAHQLFLEDRVGSIEVGKDADLAVWDKNMYSIPTSQIQNLKCELTLVAGHVVYDASKRWATVVSRELEAGLRLAAGLPRYLRHTLSYQDACDIIARRAQTRSQNFLRLVRRAVFDQSSSPYLPLFKAAQCDYQDVVDGLERENLESFLRRLKDAGVWISFDEYKGRVPITRGNLTHPVAEGSFDNRIAKRGFTATTGGSSGRATRAMVDLEFLAERAPYDHLMFAMLDLGQVPFALWYPKVPASVALIQCLRYAKIGQTLTEWFDMTLGGDVVPRWQVWGVDAVITASRFFPTRFPRPRKVAIKDPGPIVDWLLAMRARHGRAALQSTVSGVLRVAHLAADRGVRLNGVQFVVGSEPLTAARQCLIEATGARVYSRYHAIDVGTIAQECGHPAEPGDLHLATDTVIALQQEQAENTPSPLYVTQLIDTSPKVLINTEIGDAAILSNRRCGCLWESCGLQTHLTSVRSYRRSTAEGLAISYAELGRIAEEVLPARFGGAALNYQWAEESNEKGVTQLWLRVDPRVGPIEDGQLRQTVLDVLRQLDPAHRFYAQMMDNAEIIRVRREPPRIGSHGKTPAVIRQSL